MLAPPLLGLLILLPLATAAGSGAGGTHIEIHPAVRVAVTPRGDLQFEVLAGDGETWDDLAERFALSRADAEALERLNGEPNPTAGRHYPIPYAVLRPEYKFLGIAALFPDDVATEEGWRHRVGSASIPLPEESLFRLAFWLTGDGENFRRILAANGLGDPFLHKGQEILVPREILQPPFRLAPGRRPADLEPGRDAQGEYASYRLKPGEALYSAVVLRFTGRIDPDDVDEAVERIARRSGIKDIHDIPAGSLIRIPMDLVAEEHRPLGDPQRLRVEMDRLLAGLYKPTVRSRDLAGITVIIDPGHGGIDIGTKQNGIWEDDTVYDIGVRLLGKLRARTAARAEMTVLDQSQGEKPHEGRFSAIDRDEVVLTQPRHHATDAGSRAVAVNLRAFLANAHYRKARQAGAGDEEVLFISLHADALHPTVRGAMVYVPGERYRRGEYGASGPTYTRYAEVRRQPRLTFTRAERLRSEGLSREFASSLVSAFRAHGLAIHAEQPIRDHVVRQGRSWLPAVLRGNQVPIKVLLEVANAANREDARLLGTPAQRDLMADAVVDALLAFYRGRAGGPVS